jgi:hypothetical protein
MAQRRSIDIALVRAQRTLRLKPGDLYEDCAYHPVLCLGVDYRRDEIWGISLVDGSYPRSCSLIICGVRRITAKEAWSLRLKGPADPKVRARIKPERRWWTRTRADVNWTVGLIGPRPKRSTKARGA